MASENFAELLDPGLRKVFRDEYDLPDSLLDQLYGVETSKKAVEYDYGVGGTGDLSEFTGTIEYDDTDPQYKITYTHKEWVKGLKIERKLIDDEQYNIINNRPKLLALSAKRTREKHGASLFNNAFNATIFSGGDGLSLCNAAHTWKGTDTTQSNIGTSALSATSLAATRLAMRDFLDETDNILNARGDTLLVPPELEQTAWELIMSDKKIDSADNNSNFFKGRYKVLVWDYLSDTNNWFLIDNRYAKIFLKWFNRIPTEFNKDKDFDSYVGKWSVYTRYSYGFSNWSWVYGSEVS